MCPIQCVAALHTAHAQRCGLVPVLGSFIWLRCFTATTWVPMLRFLLNAFTKAVVLYTSLQGTKRQVRITATVTLLDAALFPGDFAQTVQVCPVSPRVIWRNLTLRLDQSEKEVLTIPISWRQWMFAQYARSCWGLPAIAHVLVVLISIFHSNLWAGCLYLLSVLSAQ